MVIIGYGSLLLGANVADTWKTHFHIRTTLLPQSTHPRRYCLDPWATCQSNTAFVGSLENIAQRALGTI